MAKPEETKGKSGDLNSLAYRLNENQLNDLFNLLNSNGNSGSKSYFKNPLAKHEAQIAERKSLKKQVSPKADLLQQHNDDIEKYFKEASGEVKVESVVAATTEASTTASTTTTSATTTVSSTTRAREMPTTTRQPVVAILPQAQRQSAKAMQQLSMFRNSQQPQFAYGMSWLFVFL